MEYEIEADGTATAGRRGPVVAFFSEDGTIQDRRRGQVIGFLQPDGTVLSGRRGQKLGTVEANGTVKNTSGQVVGNVSPPVFKQGALLLILG